MRLQPKTPGGTWLLAGLVWTAACAVAWTVLPARPKAAWALPARGWLCCGLSGGILVTADEDPTYGPRPAAPPRGLLRLWDANAGRLLCSVAGPPAHFYAVRPSRTGRWLALSAWDPDSPMDTKVWLLDLTDGRLEVAAQYNRRAVKSWGDVWGCWFGPDDRWLACVHSSAVRRLSLPGLTPEGEVGSITGKVEPDPGGRVMALTWGRDGQSFVNSFDMDTLVETPGLPLFPKEHEVWEMAVAAGGAVIAAGLRSRDTGAETRVWEVVTGREVFRGPGSLAGLAPDGRTLVCTDTSGAPVVRLTFHDLASGASAGKCAVADTGGFDLMARPLYSPFQGWTALSPDGQTVALPLAAPLAGPIRDWAQRLGLSRLLGGDPRRGLVLFDPREGRKLGHVADVSGMVWSPDGAWLATLDEQGRTVRVWDIPPRKTCSWLFTLAVLMAVPSLWIARRHVRRLRREGAT
jgi:WD40 repeat protein